MDLRDSPNVLRAEVVSHHRSGDHTEFAIRVSLGPESDCDEWICRRRYSDFRALHRELVEARCTGVDVGVPSGCAVS